MANRFKQAAPKAKKLYRSGRYKTFAEAMKAALKSTHKPKAKRRRVGATKFIERHETRSTPVTKVVRVIRTKAGRYKKTNTLSGIMAKGRAMLKEKIDTKVLQKYHATGKRHKKKIQKGINELKAALRRLS